MCYCLGVNFNTFFEKINLPALCKSLKLNNLNFVHVPRFGWYAVNQETGIIQSPYEIFDFNETKNIYAFITKKKPELLYSPVEYSELVEARINTGFLAFKQWMTILIASMEEIKQNQSIIDRLSESGYLALLNNKVGLLSRKVINDFVKANGKSRLVTLPTFYEDKLIIPSWVTPSHIGALEVCNIKDINVRTQVYLNKKKGWYGDIQGDLVESINSLYVQNGHTWDDKCLSWKKDYVLNKGLSVNTVADIWLSDTNCEPKPLDYIVTNNLVDQMDEVIHRLTPEKLDQLSKITGEEHLTVWRNFKLSQITCGTEIFIRKYNKYFVQKKGELEEITNFAVEISEIYQNKATLLIYYKEEIFPVSIPLESLYSDNVFSKNLRKMFITSGLGVPNISTAYDRKLLAVVSAFNTDTKLSMHLQG